MEGMLGYPETGCMCFPERMHRCLLHSTYFLVQLNNKCRKLVMASPSSRVCFVLGLLPGVEFR